MERSSFGEFIWVAPHGLRGRHNFSKGGIISSVAEFVHEVGLRRGSEANELVVLISHNTGAGDSIGVAMTKAKSSANLKNPWEKLIPGSGVVSKRRSLNEWTVLFG